MPTFKGKERHERGEMPGAFWEKDARNPEKAPLFLEGKRQNGQGNPVKILRNEEFQERDNRPVRQRGIAAYHRNRPA